MKITLLRHAEVDSAYHGCYNGHIDITLSEAGKAQAKKLSAHFDSQCFDGVFCSDLIRARETLGYFSHAKDAVYTDKLREKSWGRHEGLSYDEICTRENIEYRDFTQWINALDGELPDKYVKRVESFFFEYLPSLDKENLFIVTHAGVIRIFISIVKNITLEEAFEIALPYGSYIIYDDETKDFSEVKV